MWLLDELWVMEERVAEMKMWEEGAVVETQTSLEVE
jgi:hypothetical protein